MNAKKLTDILKKGDNVAVSNITGREASKVTVISQNYCNNITGGWALGKDGQLLECGPGKSIPVFATFGELVKGLPGEKLPNKIVVYSPPEAVYGEVKEILYFGKNLVETIFIITEHVSVEVTAKIHLLANEAKIDVIGCNTLGFINVYDSVRVGAIGGDNPSESFKKGSACIISNSGNMVTTMATYLLSAGIGCSFGISTGKDTLILTPLKELLALAAKDSNTHFIVLYVEPGGIYEKEAMEMMQKTKFPKPVIVYVAGRILETQDVSLGHAGAVVESHASRATEKMALFDSYFGIEPFDPLRKYEKNAKTAKSLKRGIRIQTLHHLPEAASLILRTNRIERAFTPSKKIQLNPWFANYGELGKKLPVPLVLPAGNIAEPYFSQFSLLNESKLGKSVVKRNMRNASYASGNDGTGATVYGIPVTDLMREKNLADSVILHWFGEMPKYSFETRLVEMCLIASLTNGPGTISAQGAKLSASAGNLPHTGMIAALAAIGEIHGGNGKEAAEYLIRIFEKSGLQDPYDKTEAARILGKIVNDQAEKFKKEKMVAIESGLEYEKIPCLGHPVFKNSEVNYDPREQLISGYMKEKNVYNIFLDFYHRLVFALKETGATSKVLAVNLDAAIACVCMGIAWKLLREKRITIKRATAIPFVLFALGRAAGAAGEFLDHSDHGTDMDMRVPTSECQILTRQRPLRKPR
ncbi:MAG TPA: citrate/2-methylcitrate synthase [bacterium]|nr:citrate/2-methylcitrate synthase [bacterium]